jgi:MFS family permease
MNTFKDLFKTHPGYFFISFAALLSSIGTGLTQVAVYGQLGKIGGTAGEFALAYSLSVVPSLFSSHLADRWTRRWNLSALLSLSAFVGALALLLPIYALQYQNIKLLLTAEFIGAAVAAFNYPISQIIIKRHFKDELLSSALKLDSSFFSIQVILGVGIGTLLFDRFGAKSYLWIDFSTYLVAATAFLFSRFFTSMRLEAVPIALQSAKTFSWGMLSKAQLRGFLLLPALTLVGTPAITALPLLGQKFGSQIEVSGIIFTPALLFIFAKCLGQMIGPFLIPNGSFEKYGRSERLFWTLLMVFVALYSFVAQVKLLILALLFVVLAHICSNMVYALGIHQMQTSFSEVEIGAVSSRIYQIQILIMTVVSLVTGGLVGILPLPILMVICMGFSWILLSRVSKPAQAME